MHDVIRCPENPLIDFDERPPPQKPYKETGIPQKFGELSIPPQPHFVPGYTGWTPGCGPKRHFILGDRYGKYTHNLTHGHRVAGSRLSALGTDKRFVEAFISPPRLDPAQKLPNPHWTLEPHFIPGYTGDTPLACIKRYDAVGETYGRMTHLRLAQHRVGGDRLRPIYDEPPGDVHDREEVKFYCNKHEVTAKDLVRRAATNPGYAGHMPRARFRHGKTYARATNEGIAEFEKIMEKKCKL